MRQNIQSTGRAYYAGILDINFVPQELPILFYGTHFEEDLRKV